MVDRRNSFRNNGPKKKVHRVSARPTGTVVRYVRRRGFGFIRMSGNIPDVYVHATAVYGGYELRVGDVVEFDYAENGRGGVKAVDVIVFEARRGSVWTQKKQPKDAGHQRFSNLW